MKKGELIALGAGVLAIVVFFVGIKVFGNLSSSEEEKPPPAAKTKPNPANYTYKKKPHRASVAYETVRNWGNHLRIGKLIVISPNLANEEDLKFLLCVQLKAEAERYNGAFVQVFTSAKGAALRDKIGKMTPSEDAFFEKHWVGMFGKGRDGNWSADAYPEGFGDGPWTSWANGQKTGEGTNKDGESDGLYMLWHENGQKEQESTHKDGEELSAKYWNRKGEEIDFWDSLNLKEPDQFSPTIRFSRGSRWAGGGFGFGAVDRRYFKKLIDYAVQQDAEAFNKALAQGLLAGQCTTFRDGETVFVTDSAIFSGSVRVRRKGETREYWTNIEAIK